MFMIVKLATISTASKERTKVIQFPPSGGQDSDEAGDGYADHLEECPLLQLPQNVLRFRHV
jgi:hypothetical protein